MYVNPRQNRSRTRNNALKMQSNLRSVPPDFARLMLSETDLEAGISVRR